MSTKKDIWTFAKLTPTASEIVVNRKWGHQRSYSESICFVPLPLTNFYPFLPFFLLFLALRLFDPQALRDDPAPYRPCVDRCLRWTVFVFVSVCVCVVLCVSVCVSFLCISNQKTSVVNRRRVHQRRPYFNSNNSGVLGATLSAPLMLQRVTNTTVSLLMTSTDIAQRVWNQVLTSRNAI